MRACPQCQGTDCQSACEQGYCYFEEQQRRFEEERQAEREEEQRREEDLRDS